MCLPTRLITDDTDLARRLRACASLLTGRPRSPCPFLAVLLGGKSRCTAHTPGLRSGLVSGAQEFSAQEVCFLSPACLCVPCVYPHGLVGIYLTLSVPFKAPSFCCSDCPSFGRWELLQLAPMSLSHTPLISGLFLLVGFLGFEHVLTSWSHYRMLGLEIPSPRVSRSSQEHRVQARPLLKCLPWALPALDRMWAALLEGRGMAQCPPLPFLSPRSWDQPSVSLALTL